jgi:hypothetical protein
MSLQTCSGKLALLLIVFCHLLLFGCSSKSNDATKPPNLPDTTRPATAIDRDSLFYKLVAEDSTTVFDLTVKKYFVEYETTTGGNFVYSINSIDQGNDYFWVYAVNDTMGQVAANNRKIGPGDRIVWHYRLITR